jgi:CTP:molybdopterin cytidylyltransferase MocA
VTSGVAAIVLAAGASVRMGSPKPLVQWRGRAFVRHVIDALRDAGCDPIVVVEGAHALPDDAIAGARRVVHEGWANGPLSSLQAGLRATGEGAVLLATVDRPHVGTHTIAALLAAHAEHPDAVVQPRFAGRRGHPLVLPASLRAPVLAAAPTDDLRAVLARAHAQRRELAVDDPAVLDNVDTPADLARLLDE